MTRKLYSFTLALFTIGCALNSSAQTITTLAGTGSPAFSGDGALATAAGLNNPYGVAVDASGNVYIADNGNHRIRKVNYTTGIITTIAGTGTGGYLPADDGGPATAAQLQNPRGITIDPSGNVVFSDYGNNRIRKINQATGIITTIAGIGGIPTYVATDDGGPATAAHLGYAWGVAYDASGNLYIADNQNCRVRKVSPSGIITSIAGTGNCFISGDGGQATAARVQYPTGVAVDGANNLYIADDGNNRVRKVTPAGIISTIAGSPVYGFTGDGGPSTASQLYYPKNVACDAAGNVYVCDQNNDRIRKINIFGNIYTYAGNGVMGYGGDGGAPAAAAINHPTGFAQDALRGKFYICDNDNNRVRVINTFNFPYFLAGSRQVTTWCDGHVKGLDTMLAIDDIDVGQTEAWAVLTPPMFGTVSAAYTTTSTGGTVLTSGSTYTPLAGYTGVDSFSVQVYDGIYYDTTTIVIYPNAGVITGIDSVCPDFTVSLSNVIGGGVWSSSNDTLATVSATGLVTGISGGVDTIRYTVTNSCATTVAIFPLLVRDTAICPGLGAANVNASVEVMNVFPNPSNGSFAVNVASGTKEETYFVLTNLVGKKVRRLKATTNSILEVNLDDQPAGIYFLSASNSHHQYTKKIVIEK